MYLMVAGGILFTLEVLVLLALLPCAYDAHKVQCLTSNSKDSSNYDWSMVSLFYQKTDDADGKIVAGLMPLVALAMFAVTIWGSVVVFGKLNKYTGSPRLVRFHLVRSPV